MLGVSELGSHTQFIGEVRDVKVEEALLGEDGRVLVETLRPILWAAGSGMYYSLGKPIGKAFSIGRGLVE